MVHALNKKSVSCYFTNFTVGSFQDRYSQEGHGHPASKNPLKVEMKEFDDFLNISLHGIGVNILLLHGGMFEIWHCITFYSFKIVNKYI
jgi:hypothetical protein